MKLLLFSDLHCNERAATSLVARAKQVDVVIGAGDFANLRRGIHQTIDILQTIEQPTVLVAGNSESVDELQAACTNWESAHVLHGNGVTIHDVTFYGLGGAVPVTPFGSWSYDITEAEAAALLADCPEGGVLVSHSPPKGVVDVSSRGRSLGSTSVRDAILQKRPLLVVCGHIHESAGQYGKIGTTFVVNAGPKGIEWTLPGIVLP